MNIHGRVRRRLSVNWSRARFRGYATDFVRGQRRGRTSGKPNYTGLSTGLRRFRVYTWYNCDQWQTAIGWIVVRARARLACGVRSVTKYFFFGPDRMAACGGRPPDERHWMPTTDILLNVNSIRYDTIELVPPSYTVRLRFVVPKSVATGGYDYPILVSACSEHPINSQCYGSNVYQIHFR